MGVPGSSGRAFPCSMQVWSYRPSPGSHREPRGGLTLPFSQDILGRITIAVVVRPTLGTGPLPLIEVKVLQNPGHTPNRFCWRDTSDQF